MGEEVTSAYATAANNLKTIIDAEFAADGFSAIHDDIHESLGWNGVRIGISPIRDVPNAGNKLMKETWLEVKFYGLWVKEITPETVVDPRVITEYAERFMRAIEAAARVTTDVMWYYNIEEIAYPRDPNGNRSRFVATIRAWGNNTSLIETVA